MKKARRRGIVYQRLKEIKDCQLKLRILLLLLISSKYNKE